MVLQTAAALLLGCTALASASTNGTAPLGIVNGDPTDYEQWRGMLAVRSTGLCSGVAISPHVVLSAEHCCRSPVHEYSIEAGADVFSDSKIDYGSVRQLANAPFGDLCMLHLERRVNLYTVYQNSSTRPPTTTTFTDISVAVTSRGFVLAPQLPDDVPYYDIASQDDIKNDESTTLVGYGPS